MTPTSLISLGVLILILIPIVRSDLRDRRIPNYLNVVLALAGLAVQVFTAPSLRVLLLGLLAPLAIIALFLTLILIMKMLRRRGTLGLGDVKFLAAASLWVGFVGSTMLFVLASLLALAFVLARTPWRPLDLKRAIPFAPFLAAGLLLVYLFAGPLHEAKVVQPVAIAATG